MQLLFDSQSVSFDMIQSDVTPIFEQVISHLRHVDIPFRQWDNPYMMSLSIQRLIDQAQMLGIEIDRQRCVVGNQAYFNFLHGIFEKNYDGNPVWLDFHENIHICEQRQNTHQFLNLNFREKGGLVEKPFNLDWLNASTTKIAAGDVFLVWSELGKTPYSYWCDREPNDIDRINELCKPWLKLRPKICMSLEDYDYTTTCDEFDSWWEKYHDAWCRHWQIAKWNLVDMESKLIIGKMSDTELHKLQNLLRNGETPRRIVP